MYKKFLKDVNSEKKFNLLNKPNTIVYDNYIDELKGATAHIGAKINLPTPIPVFGQASMNFNPNLNGINFMNEK